MVQFPWKIQITRIFRVLLRFRANSGDNKLKSHLLNCPRKNTNVSAAIKNEILDIFSKIIQNKIVKKANTTGAFTIIADKTLDACYTVHEDFLIYCTCNWHECRRRYNRYLRPMYKTRSWNGKIVLVKGTIALARWVGSSTAYKLKSNNCTQKQSTFIVCLTGEILYCHQLQVERTWELSWHYDRNNAYSGELLKSKIKKYVPESKITRNLWNSMFFCETKLHVCETRFNERHDTVNVFVGLYEAIVPSLIELSGCDRSISSCASGLLTAIEKSYFVVSLWTCEKLFTHTVLCLFQSMYRVQMLI